jgi:predicted P-loop ATPase
VLILAEAVQMFVAGVPWWFSPEEKFEAEQQTVLREEGSTIVEAVERWWFEMQPARRPKSVTLLEVAELALRIPVDRVDRRIRSEIGHAMAHMKFKSGVRRRDGARPMVYEPTQALLDEPARRRFAEVAPSQVQ